jgi:serine/threonine-protein kinase
MIGQTIGSYHVTAKLGSGGMGDVYRATDTRLGRDVAIKFPGERFTERFEREARAVAALNHPNICTLYDVASNYLVMEFVDGVTLAERIVEGPIPLEEALSLARQIAAALEEAHEKGITHRDLKPANIKIRSDGTVKVLDFGLAKLSQSATASPSPDAASAAAAMSLSPTMSLAATQAGVIIGTAAYMSPEQAKGKPVDKRADIWAFGVVLYEMLTGRQPFRGDDVGDVLASVIKEEPDWSEVPSRVRTLLRKCLETDPKKRLRDISGVDLLLDEGTTVATPVARPRTAIVHYALEAVLVVGLALTAWLLWPARPPDRPLMSFNVDLGPNVNLASLRGTEVIISPDGNRIAYVSQNKLFTRRLDQDQALELPGTDGSWSPFFSPDGQWIGFFTAGKLKKISVNGGTAMALADGNGAGASWGEDGYIVASLDFRMLMRVPENGGAPTTLLTTTEDESGHRWPQVLPGGKAVLYTSRRAGGEDVRVVTLADHRTKILQQGASFGRYFPGANGAGYLLFMNGSTLFAAPFDLQRLDVLETPAPVIEGVAMDNRFGTGAGQFDVTGTGTLVYRPAGPTGDDVALHWVDATAKSEPLPTKAQPFQHPRLSPDGTRIALTLRSGTNLDIAVYDIQRDFTLKLTFGGGDYQFPVWTPDGHYVVFSSGIAGGGIYWTRADGGTKPQLLLQSKDGDFPWSFTKDGKRLAYAEFPRGSGDIWTVPIEYDGGGMKAGKPEIFLQTPANELYPAFSPDGRWIAYRSFESGPSEVYVRSFPDSGAKYPISGPGGAIPIWSPTGNELFYRTEDQRIMVVPYTQTQDAFVPNKPRLWTEVRLAQNNQRNLDIGTDGKRFIALMPVATTQGPVQRNHVVFLQNFADELGRRMGPSTVRRE